jgi:D-alanyl-D-alanine carboxypeptidase/D-alanyl-D-alanine-endopeptidase (penicillin-binding protein 4)
MRAFAFLLFWCVVALPVRSAELATAGSLSLSELRRHLTDHVSQPKFSQGTWGIKIVSLESAETIFETNAHKLLKPASNAKTFTGALALDVLGPDFRIRTSLLAKSTPDRRGRLNGDLIIYGRGDPSFAARFHDGNYTNLLAPVIDAIRNAGIKQIDGDLVGDDTFFNGPPYGASWTWDDLQYYYGAEVSALTYQDNVIDLVLQPSSEGKPCKIILKPDSTYLELINRTRTGDANRRPSINVIRPLGERRAYITGGLPRDHKDFEDSVTVPQPALWFVHSLREELNRAGIKVRGKLRTQSWPDDEKINPEDYKELGFAESAPISEIVARMLKPSQNLYAQLLLLQVGAQSNLSTNRNNITTEDAGIAELRAFATRAGIDPGEVLLDEGSGLSRSALVTPHALVSLQKFMATHPHAAIYREALPAPGEGTLRTRFKDLSSGKLRAKTGTIRYVNALSGYLETAAHEQLAFALLLNAHNQSSPESRAELDTIIRLLTRLTEKTEKQPQ